MTDVANTQDFEGHRGTVAMFLDSLLSRQGWGCLPAWRVLVEVRVVEPLRIPQPNLGKEAGQQGSRSDRGQIRINPRRPHIPERGEIRDVPPDQDTEDNPLKGRTGETTRTRSQNAAHRHRSMGA